MNNFAVRTIRRQRAMRSALFISALFAATAALASPPPGLSAADRRSALQDIEHDVATTYVFPELRPKIIAELEQSRQAHRYDVADATVFAQRVTEDMNKVTHDGHLYLSADAPQYSAMRAPATAPSGLDAYETALALRDHSGLTKLDILPGNIRYLRVDHFQWIPKVTRAAYDDAARFLKDGDAVIFDLRGNGGGESDAADFFFHDFLPPDPNPAHAGLRTSLDRDPRWIGKPLYLLVDGYVASAAEAVAYGAQQEKTAIIVGSNTVGAANNNKKFAVAPQFVLSVSYHRPVNPISFTNWEGVGVRPDIEVPGPAALDAAQRDALDRLIRTPGVPPRTTAEYRWALTSITARLHPIAPAAERQATTAGTFGTITLKNTPAGLLFYRSDRPKRPQGVLMTPLDHQGLFGVDGYDDLRVRVTATQLILLHGAEDEREVFSRSTVPRPR